MGNTEPTDAASILSNPLCKYYGGVSDSASNTISCQTTLSGRYITIQIMDDTGNAILTLCDVTPVVGAPPPAGCTLCELGMICPGGNDGPESCPAGMMTLTAGARSNQQCGKNSVGG